MRIISKEEFWNQEPPFIFARWEGGCGNGLYECFEFIRRDNGEPIDYGYVDLCYSGIYPIDSKTKPSDVYDWSDSHNYAISGKSFRLDLECGQRDGLYNKKEMFVLYDDADILNIAGFLYKHFANRYEI